MTSQNLDPEYKCQKCRDKGHYTVIDNERVEREKECECAAQRRIERLIEKSGVAEAFKACNFENFKPWEPRVAQAKGLAEAYVLDFPRIENKRENSFALMGEVGSGKTMLGVCVMNALTKQGISALYAPYREMVAELKNNVLDDKEYARALRKYTEPRILFIDDLYKGATQNDPKYVYDVVNARYLLKRPLIVTTELGANNLLDIDVAVGSRIIEMCKDYTFELRGAGLNYRLRGLFDVEKW